MVSLDLIPSSQNCSPKFGSGCNSGEQLLSICALSAESERASIHLCHATEEDNSARCCHVATGHQPKDTLTERSSEPEKEGYQPNATGRGVGPGMDAIHQQVQRKREKMLRLAKLQRKIDEATEKMCYITQDDQGRRPQHRELR
jgi:adenylosuccinate synthase